MKTDVIEWQPVQLNNPKVEIVSEKIVDFGAGLMVFESRKHLKPRITAGFFYV